MSNIWYLLNTDSLANDAGFGLEYYTLGNFDSGTLCDQNNNI